MIIDKKFIEEHVGYEVQDMKLEPIYEDGECVGLKIFVTPKMTLRYIELDFKVLPTGSSFEEDEIGPTNEVLNLQESTKNKDNE